ncbi:MAG: hypothetical protein HQK97_04505 [Nitrospirae bacterium]|nr:hypothetical protein [Nitrospirota bacterium]
MNEELLMLKGQLSEYERELRRLYIAIAGDKNMVRLYLPSHIEDAGLTSMKTNTALEAMTRMHENTQKAKKVEGNIKAIKSDLGQE